MATYSYLFKFIVIGDSGVGKSCLLLQFTDRRFTTDHDLTIGVEFGAKTINVSDKTIKLQIWDTAGQENFKSVTRAYFRGAVAALLVYDVTSRESFDHVSTWLKEAKQSAGEAVTTLLVGNKTDLLDRAVTSDEASAFAQQEGMLYIETSAKTGKNINEAFTLLTCEVLKNIEAGRYDLSSEANGIKVGRPSLLERGSQAPQRRCNC